MKLHRYIDHDCQMTPINFQVTRDYPTGDYERQFRSYALDFTLRAQKSEDKVARFFENLLAKKSEITEACFTLHKLADMRRTGVGKPRPLLDQEKLDLFRVAKKFDQLVADLERKMRAALRRLKEMLKGLD
ncbi:hypothetical protein DPMN_019239 [Dreissena polymorpha]|uniref:Uncharacterized protein n=1 Tax=Dreissena polymorpha TaxID=45954 RepID=A0A9D4S745_DREPO|nr:hypothetical protein DPMN_019239 [Dreissena polymorpha]